MMAESNSGSGYTVVNLSVRMIFVVVNLIENSVILVFVPKSHNLSYVTRHLIGQIAIADIGFGLFMAVHAFLVLGGATMDYPICLGLTTIAIISGLYSCWGICLVFLDNYLSVRRTGPAQTGLSLREARWCIISGWMLSVIGSLVYLLEAPTNITTTECYMGDATFTCGSLLYLAVLMLVGSFAPMFFMCVTLYMMKKRMDTLFREGTHVQNVLRQRNLKMRSRIIRVFTTIAVGLIISWCPVAVAAPRQMRHHWWAYQALILSHGTEFNYERDRVCY